MYLGERGDYVVVDGHYCSCEGFTRRITRKGLGGCSHVYGARLALAEGLAREHPLDPVTLARVVWEALTGGRAITLRRLLAKDVGDDNYHGEG